MYDKYINRFQIYLGVTVPFIVPFTPFIAPVQVDFQPISSNKHYAVYVYAGR